MIKVLNSKNREELEEIHISDKTATIFEIKKVLQKRNLINQWQTKCEALNVIVQRFHKKFNVLNQKGLLGLVGLDNRLVRLEYYCKNLYTIVIDKSKFANIKGHITGRAFLEALQFDLMIHHQIKKLFIQNPTFDRFTEVDEIFRKKLNMEITSEDQRDKFLQV